MKRKKKFRRSLLVLPIGILAFCAVYAGSEIYERRDYQSHFIERKGLLVSRTETTLEQSSHYSLLHIQLEDDTGLRVEGHIKIPSPEDGLYPAFVMLGGLRTGRRVVDYIDDVDEVVLLALDYPYDEKKSEYGMLEFIRQMPDMRRAIMNTVPATMLSIDYLMERKEVDTTRIVLIGGSVGALFAPAIAACDLRISAVALLFGAGDLQSLLYANLDAPAPLAAAGARFGGLLVSPVEPLKYVDRIAPRPLFMLNGTDDIRMPERCIRQLHEKAKEPKDIRWIASGHLHVRSKEFHDLVRRELVSWLVQQGMTSDDSAAADPAPR